MEYKKWFEQAREDFSTASYNLTGQKFYACAFFCQQCVEKIFKAVLIKEKGILFRVHDLFILGKKARVSPSLLKKCSELSFVYTDSRYGIGEKIPSKKFNETDCCEYLSTAKGVLEWAEKKI